MGCRAALATQPTRCALQEYLCRRCGATYTSLDAIRLLDPASGAFRCEECRAELEANMGTAGLGGAGAGAGPAASRQQLQQYAKRMLEKLDQQLRPLLGARHGSVCAWVASAAGTGLLC